MTDDVPRRADWEAIEREFRASQLSVRQIAENYGVSEGAIRKKAKKEGWTRPLAEKVRAAVREKLVREDGTRDGTHPQRANDADLVEMASERGFQIRISQRRDIEQLHALKRIIATRLSTHLQGGEPDGPFMGEKESPGDLLEKLSRITSRLMPLEGQAYNLDANAALVPTGGIVTIPVDPIEASRVYQRIINGGA